MRSTASWSSRSTPRPVRSVTDRMTRTSLRTGCDQPVVSRGMSPLRLVVPLVVAAGLLAGCGSKPAPTSGAPTPDQTAPPTTAVAGGPTPTTPRTTGTTGSGDWPSPEDCVSYDPTALTTRYDAGFWTVSDGSVEAVR